MKSAEDQLADAIWEAMQHHRVTTDFPVEFTTTVTELAKAYAAGDSEWLTSARRQVLAAAAEPTPLPVARGEGPAPELSPSGSGFPLEVPEGATMSTGGSIPPQASVDKR